MFLSGTGMNSAFSQTPQAELIVLLHPQESRKVGYNLSLCVVSSKKSIGKRHLDSWHMLAHSPSEVPNINGNQCAEP